MDTNGKGINLQKNHYFKMIAALQPSETQVSGTMKNPREGGEAGKNEKQTLRHLWSVQE